MRLAAIAAGLLAALAATALPSVPPAAAQSAAVAAAGQRFSRIDVDVRPLLAKGLGSYAEGVRAELATELRRAFADRMDRTGPALVVRITGISLDQYAGSDRSFGGRGFGGGAMNSDYLEGEALVVGRGGEILLRHPQLSATNADSGGAWYDPASEARRRAYLAWHYAQWLRRAFD